MQREDVRLDIESMTCSCCGGALRVIGGSVSEMLDWIPAQLRVIRTTRPKYACRICATIVEAAALGGRSPAAWRPRRCLPRSWSANIVITRRSIGSRRSSPAMGSIFPVRRWLDGSAAPAGGSRRCTSALPGTCSRRTISCRRYDGPGAGRSPAAVYLFAPDRKAERPAAHLEHFKGDTTCMGHCLSSALHKVPSSQFVVSPR